MAQNRKAAGSRFDIDPAHERLDIYSEDFGGLLSEPHSLTLDVWRKKYRWGEEEHPFDSMLRVVEGVYAKDPSKEHKRAALEAMQKGLWVPAGRIQAGAGTQNVVTLLNCYMCRDIEDSMSGIADALKDAMLTMQQGGGIGMNFSTLRPSGAFLARTGAVASGPLPFMDMWDSMCGTIMSAGSRRGAMMAVMHCEHPDLPKFITAKHEPGRLTNFNVSVLITDAFMDAVACDEDWYLGFSVPRKDGKHLFVCEKETDDGEIEMWYAYEKWRAKDLWNLIMENTYEWSEPGVIFIDRINQWNNLSYCETITGTNPCGEQPLPPNGCCNLGAVNLAKMVSNPFSPHAAFDFDLLKEIVGVGVRFLDNVIDTTLYPLDAQATEEFAKRRIGVGITGLANCLSQLGLVYGSEAALAMTHQIMETLRDYAYLESAHLAEERGTFPLYDAMEWAMGSPVYAGLPDDIKAYIRTVGVRNGVLLTIAPTGTTSLYVGNVSSGLEPVFAHQAQRNVRQEDDTFRPYTVYDYGYLLWCSVKGLRPEGTHQLPSYIVDHEDISADAHIEMQAVCQAHIDASVSKTINCKQSISFEAFKQLYDLAWERGCKGCTTYRYSEVRGAILSKGKGGSPSLRTGEGEEGKGGKGAQGEHAEAMILKRPDVLSGRTYKVKWPNANENYYITINDIAGHPFEMFIQSTSSKYADWTTALSLMISAIMRKGGDISFIPEELRKVRSADDQGWVNGRLYGSLVALFGETIGEHFKARDIQRSPQSASNDARNPQLVVEVVGGGSIELGATCPDCNQPTVYRIEGCDRCISCDYSRCG